MRHLACFLALAILPLRADDLVGSVIRDSTAPRKEFPSFDGKWVVGAWLTGKGAHCGYLYSLRDRRTGAVYIPGSVPSPQDAPVRDIDALWSPGGRYVALTIYYGPAVENVMVIHCRNIPRLAAFPEAHDSAFLRPEDRARFLGFNRLRYFTMSWTGPAELAVGATTLAVMQGKDGTRKTLVSDIVDTIRFRAENGALVRRKRTAYAIAD